MKYIAFFFAFFCLLGEIPLRPVVCTFIKKFLTCTSLYPSTRFSLTVHGMLINVVVCVILRRKETIFLLFLYKKWVTFCYKFEQVKCYKRHGQRIVLINLHVEKSFVRIRINDEGCEERDLKQFFIITCSAALSS